MTRREVLWSNGGKPAPTDERQFLRLVKNHADLRKKLVTLTLNSDLHTFDHHMQSVAASWFELAKEHLAEISKMDVKSCPRTAYSRSYYAAYNASKAVRYVVYGEISLGGDDHRKVAELPDSFPSVSSWAVRLTQLYEHRLRADYDNWTESATENTLAPEDSRAAAVEFLGACKMFLLNEYGVVV
jgi:hypothetical protein